MLNNRSAFVSSQGLYSLDICEANLLSWDNRPRGVHVLYQSFRIEPIVRIWTTVVVESRYCVSSSAVFRNEMQAC